MARPSGPRGTDGVVVALSLQRMWLVMILQTILRWLGRAETTAAAAPTRQRTAITPEWSDDAAITESAPRSQKLLLSRDGVDDRAGLAHAWRDVGCVAREAIATSSQLSLDLLRREAPPALLAASHEDALEAIRQAKICFALARAIDGSEAALLPRPTLTTTTAKTLAELANACLATAFRASVHARIHAKLSRRAVDPSIRKSLEEIAAIEARRSIHAFAIITWLITLDPAVASSLEMPSLHAERERRPEVAIEGGWERWGIEGAALARQEVDAARLAIRRRLEDLMTKPHAAHLAA